MSRTRRAVRGLLAACTLIFAASSALAASSRFQVEGTGTGALLSGGDDIADGHDRRDLYAVGIGFAFTAQYAVTNHLWLGFRSGLLDESKDGIDPAIALERWRHLPGYSRFRAAQATKIDRKLTTIPTHGILQWRGHASKKIGYWSELGVGVASFTDKLDYIGPNGTLMRLSAYQKNISFLAGAGLSWDVKNVTLLSGADVEQIPSRNGEVWKSGDDPRFVHILLGVRYPKR